MTTQNPNATNNEETETMIVNQPELELLKLIRSKQFEFIKIKAPDGKINFLECTKCPQRSSRISDILKENDYQAIEIQLDNGKISHIKQTMKIKY